MVHGRWKTFPGLGPGAVRPLLPKHGCSGRSDSSDLDRATRAVELGGLCLRTLHVQGERQRVRIIAAPANDHAGRADRRELSHDRQARITRYYPGDRVALSRQRVRHLPVAQIFKSVPQELVEAARVEGTRPLQILWEVYVRLARTAYVAFGLVSVGYHHWNNFLWPLIVTNSVEARPLTVGLAVFGAPETGVDWSIITAATVMTMAPLLFGLLLFQRQFVQSFMRAGIR
jgi:Binding-protein-dependent transport system inner membrane component